MHIEFHSIEELDVFLTWAGRGRQHATSLFRTLGNAEHTQTVMYPDGAVATGVPPLPDESPAAGEVPTPAAGEVPTPANAAEPKRKRRTKAEMEAARAAEAQAQAQPAAPVPDVGSEPANTGNPFAQTALPAETPSAAEPAPTAAPAQPAAAQGTSDDAMAFMQARVAEIGAVDALKHLDRARTFIAKHGTDAYNRGYALAGLPGNIMAYADGDRVLHCAALDYLDIELTP